LGWDFFVPGLGGLVGPQATSPVLGYAKNLKFGMVVITNKNMKNHAE